MPGEPTRGRPTPGRPTPSAPGRPGLRPAALSAAYLLLALLAAAVATAGALVQGGWFPGGLLLALAGCSALFYGGGRLTGTRAGAGVPAAVWLVCVIALTFTRAEGDAVFPGDLGPYIFLLVGATAGVICATLPQLPPRDGPQAGPGGRAGR
jgi:Family of unknown function (DUF6113)